jgi:hypothetical protein
MNGLLQAIPERARRVGASEIEYLPLTMMYVRTFYIVSQIKIYLYNSPLRYFFL